MGKNFITEARLLMRIVMNIGHEPLPVHIEAETVGVHARQFAQRMQRYRKKFAPPLRKFYQTYLPQQRPVNVVYLFGGGDLISALLPFPEAPELTTISLEQAGDPRRIKSIDQEELQCSLSNLKKQFGGMLSVGSNTSENLSNSQRNYLPVQLVSFLVALVVHDYEPVAVYYFTLNEDGTIHYLNESEITELNKKPADRLRLSWCRPNFSSAFANVEIQYKRRNKPEGPIQIFRHIGASLANGRFVNNFPLRNHLDAKGQVSGLVKGASYLLWQDGYAHVRDYMLTHMPFIVSDSSGIPFDYATAAGFRIKTFGKFSGSFLKADNSHNEAFRTLWNNNSYTKMPSRFGYVDSDGQPHLMFSIKT